MSGGQSDVAQWGRCDTNYVFNRDPRMGIARARGRRPEDGMGSGEEPCAKGMK